MWCLSVVTRIRNFSRSFRRLWPQQGSFNAYVACGSSAFSCTTMQKPIEFSLFRNSQAMRFTSSNAIVSLKLAGNVVKFCLDKEGEVPQEIKSTKRKMSRKAKLNELRFYRLKARKKMKSPNPEVRIRYKLEKALEKYKYEQSLEHTGQYIEDLEWELEEYHKHLSLYKKRKEEADESVESERQN